MFVKRIESEPSRAIIARARSIDARDVHVTDVGQLRAMVADHRGDPQAPPEALRTSLVSADQSLGSECFRYELATDAPGSSAGASGLGTYMRALRCRHPYWPRFGTEIAYSERQLPDKTTSDIRQEGEAFLASLTFNRFRPILVTTIPVGRAPTNVAVGHGSIWVTNLLDGTVSRIDRQTRQVVATIQVGKGPDGVATTDGAVWIANRGDNTITRLDPGTNQRVTSVRLDASPATVAVGGNAVWVGGMREPRIWRIDPEANRVASTMNVSNRVQKIAFGEGAVWVACQPDNMVYRIDPQSSEVLAKISTGPFEGRAPYQFAIGGGSVWVVRSGGSTLRIDPRTNAVTDGPAFRGARFERGGGGEAGAWLATFFTEPPVRQKAVVGIDPIRNEISGTAIAVGSPIGPRASVLVTSDPLEVAVDDDALWVVNVADGTVSRIAR